jgi:hypothetical protein
MGMKPASCLLNIFVVLQRLGYTLSVSVSDPLSLNHCKLVKLGGNAMFYLSKWESGEACLEEVMG